MTLRETAERNSLRDAADRVLDGRRYGVLAINYWDGLREAIEAALLAERTRCAEIAARIVERESDEGLEGGITTDGVTAKEILDAIRADPIIYNRADIYFDHD